MPDASFAGEREGLESVVSLLGLTGGVVVDIGASDGYSQSSTAGLFARPGWKGVAVEMNPIKFFKLAYLYAKFADARLIRHRVTPDNVGALLDFSEVPADFEVLNLDIDSYDLYVLEALLTHGYTPKIVSMEINEKIPPGIYFSVSYNDDHVWMNDHFYGCSIESASRLMAANGFFLHRVIYNNAIFISRAAAGDAVPRQEPALAYGVGYRDQVDRKALFPWNSDVEHWLHLDAKAAAKSIETYFNKYQGRFTIGVREDNEDSETT